MTYKRLCLIPANEELTALLVEMGRLKWTKQADPLEVGKVMQGLLDDWAVSGKHMRDFIWDEKAKCQKQTI
jgi:hypothetical protein